MRHRGEQRQGRVDDAAEDALARADERFGDAKDVDERGIRVVRSGSRRSPQGGVATCL